MNFTTRDLGKLQWPLLGALLMIALAILPVIWSSNQVASARSERNEAERRKTASEQRLLKVRTEEQELRERAALYQRMQLAGITGNEQRLEWTELIEKIQQQMRIPGINYEFGIRKPLNDGGAPEQGYFVSPMRIQMRLLHEEDLLNFLRRLQQEAKALILIRNCTLTPLANRPVGSTDLAQLNGECELRWITVRPPASQP
jgi:hypothetical protein